MFNLKNFKSLALGVSLIASLLAGSPASAGNGERWITFRAELPMEGRTVKLGANVVTLDATAEQASDLTLNVYYLPQYNDLDVRVSSDVYLLFVASLGILPWEGFPAFARSQPVDRQEYLRLLSNLNRYLQGQPGVDPEEQGVSNQWLESERQFLEQAGDIMTRRWALQPIVRLCNLLHVKNYVPLKINFADLTEETEMFRRATGLGMFVFWKQQYFLHDQPLTRQDVALWIFGLPMVQREFKEWQAIDLEKMPVLWSVDDTERLLSDQQYDVLLRYGTSLQRDWHQPWPTMIQDHWSDILRHGVYQGLAKSTLPKIPGTENGETAVWQMMIDQASKGVSQRLRTYAKFPWTTYYPPNQDTKTLADHIRQVRKHRRGGERLSQKPDVFMAAVLFWMDDQLSAPLTFDQLMWRYQLAQFLVRHRFVSRDALKLLKGAPDQFENYQQACDAVKTKNEALLRQQVAYLLAANPHESTIQEISNVISANERATQVGQDFFTYRNSSALWSEKLFSDFSQRPFFSTDYFKLPDQKKQTLRAVARHFERIGQSYAGLQVYTALLELTDFSDDALNREFADLLWGRVELPEPTPAERGALDAINPWSGLFATGGVKDPYW